MESAPANRTWSCHRFPTESMRFAFTMGVTSPGGAVEDLPASRNPVPITTILAVEALFVGRKNGPGNPEPLSNAMALELAPAANKPGAVFAIVNELPSQAPGRFRLAVARPIVA